MGDTDGALQSYAWFEQSFPDDSDDPLHLLCWTLVLYRVGQLKAAEAKLRQTMLSNLYLIPTLRGIEQGAIEMWYPSSLTVKSYLVCIPESIFELWEPSAIQWVDRAYHSEPMQRVRKRYIEIYTQLKGEPVGARRSQLVEEAHRLPHGLPDSFCEGCEP